MKSRSHRLPVSEPRHDDWVDGSWTVDCVCGVNFDDGEEMVDCDECGVWVHTRCSRYVKSEKSFSCDKCKNKTSGGGGGGGGGGGSARNDSEETEVAEFLVELPTKTLRMDTPNPASVSSRRPFRLWTDIPKEERVHVQGVPGGDSGLFSGSGTSSVFGSGLWKGSSYVPKKFKFKYSDFPCLSRVSDDENQDKEMEENANQADNCAGALFSLLKDNGNTLRTPLVDSVGVKSAVEDGGCHDLVSTRRKSKLCGENAGFVGPVDSVKKEIGSVTIVLHSGKRRKDDLGISKDQKKKKKMKTIEEEGGRKKVTAHSSKAASTFSSDAKHLEYAESGKDVMRDQPTYGLGECATNSASTERGRNDVLSGEMSRGGNGGDQGHMGSENFAKTSNGMEALTELNGIGRNLVKEEVLGDTLQSCQDVRRDTGSAEIGSHDKEHTVVDLRIAGPDAKESRPGQSSDIDEDNSRPNKKFKSEINAHDNGHHHIESLSLNDVKPDTMKANTQYPELSVNICSEEGKVIETSTPSSEASGQKGIDASRRLTVASSRTDKFDEPPDNPSQSKREPSGSEGSMGARRKSSGLKHSSQVADESPKSNGTPRSHSTASYQRKAVVSVVKTASTSGSIMSKSSDKRVDATAPNPSINSRQKELSESSVGTMEENASVDMVEREEKCGRPKKFVKEHPKQNILSKISESTKSSHTSDSKRPSSDSKDSKIQLVSNVESNCVSGECASPPRIESASSVQNKAALGKGEKSGNVASMNAPTSSNVPAILSDEELALLLHQELNSSPRVPRVPRMRHAGSLPQLNGPSATSTLMKRTSSCGGKDHNVASKRRSKDLLGEASHGSLDVVNEATIMERKPSSPDNRRRDSSHRVDLLSRKEADGVVKSVRSVKKTNVSSSSSPSEANGHSLLSSRPSSRNISDDDPRMAGRLTKRTLPGLIAEIMSEGKRMTYEELCNAVVPHWPHLRKHNGERYAYSSHSQAVLDCLRNRSEWARLVDRGPKTSASRKRRKLDGDSVSIDSEDNDNEDNNRVKNAKDSGGKSFDSHQENDFPKGKRKARKGRRLALQGKGIIRKRRRRADVVSDDESDSFSTSSEEDSMSSEDEIQNGGTSIIGSEASASSDEAR
ncbi:hypothetical protein ACP275_05G064600 [Erythranthe tilingii]